jgi:hypothetical protein
LRQGEETKVFFSHDARLFHTSRDAKAANLVDNFTLEEILLRQRHDVGVALAICQWPSPVGR